MGLIPTIIVIKITVKFVLCRAMFVMYTPINYIVLLLIATYAWFVIKIMVHIYVGVLLIAVLCDIYISNIMFINKKNGIRGYIVHDKLFNLVKQVIY